MLGGFTWTEKYEEAISDEHPPGFISDSFKESGNLLYLMASLFQLVQVRKFHYFLRKQLPRGVLRKRCSENMQQIYRRTPMPKCDRSIGHSENFSEKNFNSSYKLTFSVLRI